MKTYRMTLLTAAAALLSAAGLARDAGAAITQTFNYQGFLLDKATNLPVDGSKHVRFLIYPAASGGSALFTEMVCDVPMNKGRYEVEVGSQTSGGIPADIFIDNPNLWMQVEIAPTAVCGGSFDPLSPRMRLQAAAFAFNSLYASTSSAATPLFSADVIGPLSQTTNGAITISTNLFVQGGISVGSISPGQQLSVSGLVESQGPDGCDEEPYTCGFRFPDGSVQVKAAAETKWELNGGDIYTHADIKRVGIGETAPRAWLHISSGIGAAGDLVLISTGSSDLIRMTGEGRIHANYFHGDGSNLTGATAADLLRVLKDGDTMTGPLTLSGSSSMTVVNTNNSLAYSLAVTTDSARLAYHLAVTTDGFVGVGAASPAYRLQVLAPAGTASTLVAVTTGTSDVFRVDGAGNVHGLTFHGNGSGLTNVFSTDPTRVLKSGDTMDGPLTLVDGSSLTVTGSAGLAVSDGEWLSVGASTAAHKVYIDGGVLVTSSMTAQGGFFGPSAFLLGHLEAGAVTAASGTFTNFGDGQYSILTTSGIKVGPLGYVEAPFYLGSGAQLTDVLGTDSTKVLKDGDVMEGALRVEGSSLSVFGYGSSFSYALTVATITNPTVYALSVATQGNVGVGVASPGYPLHVDQQIGITADVQEQNASLVIRPSGAGGFIKWEEQSATGTGVLGMPSGSAYKDLVYRVGASNMEDGTEVFRIKQNGNFGIGTAGPFGAGGALERFHVATNMLVSTAAVNPMLYVSSITGRVGIGTNSPQTHRLVVSGDMVVASSLTVQGGIHGIVYGVIASTELYVDGNAGIGVSTPLARLHVVEKGDETYTMIVGSNNVIGLDYDMVVTTQGRVGIGIPDPDHALHVGGTLKVGTNGSLDTGSAHLQLRPLGGHSLISFESHTKGDTIAVMGTDDTPEAFIFNTNSASLGGGNEIYRITKPGFFGIYNTAPTERLHIGANTLISTATVTPILFVSTVTARVGVGTRSPSERLHLSSGAFYNDGAGAGITTLGNVTASAYYGDGGTLSGVITSTDVIVADIANRVRKDSDDTMSGALTTTGLTVNGAANFGSLPAKSTFTAEGFWQPRAFDSTAIQTLSATEPGQVILNSTIGDLCVSTSTVAGEWALAGSRGLESCW